jgi:hypothetical protein
LAGATARTKRSKTSDEFMAVKARLQENDGGEVQRRQAGEVVGKFAIIALSIGLMSLIGFSVWVILL